MNNTVDIVDSDKLNRLITEAYDRDLQKPELVSFKELSKWGRKYGFPLTCSLTDKSDAEQIHWAASLLVKVAGSWRDEDMPARLIPEFDSALYNDAVRLIEIGGGATSQLREAYATSVDGLAMMEKLKTRAEHEGKRQDAKRYRLYALFLFSVILLLASTQMGASPLLMIASFFIAAFFMAMTISVLGFYIPNRSEVNYRVLSDDELAALASLPHEMLEPLREKLAKYGRITVEDVLLAESEVTQRIADIERRSMHGFRAMMGAK